MFYMLHEQFATKIRIYLLEKSQGHNIWGEIQGQFLGRNSESKKSEGKLRNLIDSVLRRCEFTIWSLRTK